MTSQQGSVTLGSIAHKDCTGRSVVVHPVQQGQSLARIAAAYRFRDWKPIWTYNTRFERTIGQRARRGEREVELRRRRGPARCRSLAEIDAGGEGRLSLGASASASPNSASML